MGSSGRLDREDLGRMKMVASISLGFLLGVFVFTLGQVSAVGYERKGDAVAVAGDPQNPVAGGVYAKEMAAPKILFPEPAGQQVAGQVAPSGVASAAALPTGNDLPQVLKAHVPQEKIDKGLAQRPR